MAILIFDSGIGGLTVLREARVLMPDHQFIYVVDNAGFPYGNWSEGPLIERMLDLFDGLVQQHDPAMIMVACNTASTLILPYLRARYDFPIVGTVPAIKPAAERTASGQVAVLATPGTVQRDYTRALIQKFAANVNVRLVGSPCLAWAAERFMLSGEVDDQLILHEIEPCFTHHYGAPTDIVVLACTHYPFLSNVFRRLAPWPVDWLNPAEAVARHAKTLLPRVASAEYMQNIVQFTAGRPKPQMQRLLSGFGLALQ